MTFNPSVPNAGESPFVFPPQNSANFTQLKKIIMADHQFNDTAQNTDGFHRQVTFRGKGSGFTPSLPSGGNSLLYSKPDSLSKQQLHFYNGTTDFQLTPNAGPTKVTGSVSLTKFGTAGDTSAVIFTLPADSSGTIFLIYHGSLTYNYRGIFNTAGIGAVDFLIVKSETLSPTPAPILVASGAGIKIQNRANSTQTVDYFIISESL